jgi:probable HAF family extracellular repeat protein
LLLSVCQDQKYTIKDLHTAGGTASGALGIYDKDSISGRAQFSTEPAQTAFFYDDAMNNMNALTGDTVSGGRNINSGNRITGYSGNSNADFEAFYWHPDNGYIGLGFFPGGTQSEGNDINESDQVVGHSGKSVGGPYFSPIIVRRAFWWANDTLGKREIPTLAGTGCLQCDNGANGINNDGFVVGTSNTSNGKEHAFMYDINTQALTDLGTLEGETGDYSFAWELNDNEDVVGVSRVSNGETHGFYKEFSQSMIEILPLGTRTFASALDVNDKRRVVGWSADNADGTINEKAILWDADLIVGRETCDLTRMLVGVPAGHSWLLQQARSISDNGEIVGWGLHTYPDSTQVKHAFLLEEAPLGAPPAYPPFLPETQLAKSSWLENVRAIVPTRVDSRGKSGPVCVEADAHVPPSSTAEFVGYPPPRNKANELGWWESDLGAL